MSDLIFSLDVAKQGKSITALAHSYGFIQYGLDVDNNDTIYHSFINLDLTVQNEIANEIYTLRHG